MARYFFHFAGANGTVSDPDGQEFETLDAAWNEAISIGAEFTRYDGERTRRFATGALWRLWVSDTADPKAEPVFTLQLTASS
jgi:hypothetical protein